MPIPSSINDLSTSAGSNSPNGATDSPSVLDEHIRALAAFIAQLRDGKAESSAAVLLAGTQTISGAKTFSAPIVGSITGNAATATSATTAANVSRSVTGAGLASGGGELTADRTITVPKSSQAQAEAGTDDATAMTPLRTAQAIAALANPLPSIAAAAVGAVGTFAMLRYAGDASAGDLVAGSLLSYASVNSSGVAFSGTPDGTWMLCGYTTNSRASVWKRVS